jgi:hypothetical protein
MAPLERPLLLYVLGALLILSLLVHNETSLKDVYSQLRVVALYENYRPKSILLKKTKTQPSHLPLHRKTS